MANQLAEWKITPLAQLRNSKSQARLMLTAQTIILNCWLRDQLGGSHPVEDPRTQAPKTMLGMCGVTKRPEDV